MASSTHRFIDWLFDVPLRSKVLHRLARAYNRVYVNGRVDRCDIRTNGELAFVQRVATSVETVFDVGANVGDWTAELIGLNPTANVHAFEPIPGTRAKFESRGLPENVRINPFGLSNEAGSLTIFNYGDGSGMNSLYRRKDMEAKNKTLKPTPQEIQLGVLDDYCAEHDVERIDLLKIDVEGHELSVLKGATRMIAENRIGMIQIEYGTSFQLADSLLRDIFDVLAPAGMTGGKITPEGLKPEEGYNARLETFALSNWVFARPDHPVAWT